LATWKKAVGGWQLGIDTLPTALNLRASADNSEKKTRITRKSRMKEFIRAHP
jgi:hypothetical protein